tara:strand:+ start:3320 stop:3628 length:309 start_codon:yes stop_codon:yes gene_type:complete
MNKYVNGVLVAMTDEEIAEYNSEKPTDAEIIARKWVAVRAERNAKLAATDWRANSDLTLSDDWKTYRQALRDIPTQTDAISLAADSSVIDNITWPAVPGSGN